MHPLLKLGDFFIPTYGIMAVLGFGLALLLYIHTSKQYQIPKADVVYASIYALVGILIGAKAVYFLTKLPKALRHLDLLLEHPWTYLVSMFDGWVFYGGLIGGALAVLIYCRRYHMNVWPFADAVAPVIPFFHIFGRIGCHFAGCCYGLEYHGIVAINYPVNQLTQEIYVSRVPVQLMEALFNFILFLFLYFIVKKKRKEGVPIGIYVLSYSIMRFLFEFLRGDAQRGGFLALSTSQWISLLLVPVGIWLIKSKKKTEI